MSRTTDLVGRTLSEDEAELLAIYRRLKALSSRQDLAPCLTMNYREAAASLWQAVNDLGLEWEHPDEAGI